MATAIAVKPAPQPWEVPAPPLDEHLWQAWEARGREKDIAGGVYRRRAFTILATVALVAAAGLWPYVGAYDVVVRFIVAAVALGLIFPSVHLRHLAFAVVFGLLVLTFNPLVPTFAFAGEWQRALVVASAVPFVVSLAWKGVTALPRR